MWISLCKKGCLDCELPTNKRSHVQLDGPLLLVESAHFAKERSDLSCERLAELVEVASEVVGNHLLGSGLHRIDSRLMSGFAVRSPA